MHHPYVFNNIDNISDKNNNDAIAVIGAAVNKNAVDITKHCVSSATFNVVQRTKVKIEGENVNILSKGKGTTARDIQKCIDCSDWMLIPYKKYQIGIWEEKTNKIFERLKNLDKENYRDFSKVINEFIKIIEVENEKIVSDILLK